MGDGALGSDHVNYLVLRYLQESGFEGAAKSLYGEWHRSRAVKDPENFPFASAVKQYELVRIIQDGLFHDQLQASVGSGIRRFNLTSNNVDLTLPARAKSLSRRQSVYASNEQDEFPIPSPKRVRQTNVEADPSAAPSLTNGDAMDLDEKVQEEDDRSSMPSEDGAPSSEPDQSLVEMKTISTQTDKQKKVKTKTIYWTLDKTMPRAILHAAWSPASATESWILAAGEALCRLYNVSPPDQLFQDIENIDAFDLSADHDVTAVAWHPSGQYYTCAIKSPSRTDGMLPYKNRLVDVSTSGDKRPYDDWFNMITIALRYTESGKMLFAASTDGSRSVLEARDLSTAEHRRWVTAFEYVQDNVAIDIACISDTSFAICGRGMLSVWSLGPPADDREMVEDGVSARTLVQDYSHDVQLDVNFDKIRYDSRHQLLVAAASSSGDICTIIKNDDVWTAGPKVRTTERIGPVLTAIELQPVSEDAESGQPTKLAVSFMDDQAGQICLFDLTSTSCELSTTLAIGPQEPPLALAWTVSLDGQVRLAAASDEAIKIWDVAQDPPTEVLSWKAAPANWYQGDDNHLPDDEDAATEPTLSWDSKGERLAFAVGRKMAIMSILPEEEQVNGVH